ncbi:MAG: hypothetical protein COB02_02120 [Candidatus Cloacimonadota bacterium]|nr:MAG: hypothetical protein COB02_02120 [Candidatus Cloacimonadota bacterium]
MSKFKYDLISVGKCCIDEMLLIPNQSKNNNKTCIIEKKFSGGGQAATTSVIVSMLGGKSLYSGLLGYDSSGAFLIDELEQFGVETKFIKQHIDFETPKAIIVIKDGSGERTIYYEKRNVKLINPVPMEQIKNTKVLILDPEISVCLLNEVLNVKHPDTLLIYDAERQRPSLQKMMSCSDFFIASETILDIDSNKNKLESFHELQNKIQGEFIITFGSKGSFWIQKDQVTHIEAYTDIDLKDTTGAGDVYHATFAYFYPQNKNIIESMKLASVTGALSTQFLGTRDKNMFPKDFHLKTNLIKTHQLSFYEFEQNFIS